MSKIKYFGILPNETIEVTCFGFFPAYILIQAEIYKKGLSPNLLQKVRNEFGKEKSVRNLTEISIYTDE